MARNTLEDIPPVKLPKGYRLERWHPGASAEWNRLLIAAFELVDTSQNYFEIRMRSDPAFRPERILFIYKGRKAVATASAWHQPLKGAETGTVHYVAVDPEERGKALGYWVSLAVLHQMKAEGRSRVLLQTDDDRIPAILSYHKLGFVPELVDANQKKRWREVLRYVARPEVTRRFQPFLTGKPCVTPQPPITLRVENQYGYTPCRRHHPHRMERGGRLPGGDPDFLADESLYRSSRLGRATCSVRQVIAGSPVRSGLWFRYQAGEESLPKGSRVAWLMRGQTVLGFSWQQTDPEGENYLRLEVAEGVECEVLPGLAFQITKGSLKAGQEVRLIIENIPAGKTSRYSNRWNPVAARRRVYLEISLPGDEPRRRLPAPLEIDFLPGNPTWVQLLLPSTHRPGEMLEGVVTVRDRFDNRVSGFSGTLPLTVTGGTAQDTEVALSDGMGRIRIVSEATPVVARAEVVGTKFKKAVSNPSIPSEDLHYYLGDLHCHDLLSESEGYTDEVYAFARDDRRLDFFSLAVQSHGWHSNEKHSLHKFFNERFNEEGRFATLLAFEWQHSSYGDKVIHYLGGDQPYLPVEDPRFNFPGALYEALRASDAFIISHHVGYPLPGWVPGTDWSVVDNRIERCVEIWSCHGSSEGYSPKDRPLQSSDPRNTAYAALRSGLRLGFVGGSDSHSGRPGGAVREPRAYPGGLAAVWAPSLDRRSIYEGLRNRHTCALTGARIVLRMTVNGYLMGDDAPAARDAQIGIDVHSPGRLAKIEILKNTRVLKTFPCRKNEARIEFEDRTRGPAFYHCRVTQQDGQLAVGSPVWVG